MARVQINIIGSRKKLAPTKAWIFITQVSGFHLFTNELLVKVSDKEIAGGLAGYVVLWNEKEESYRSVLTGVIAQLAKKGVKRITVQHPRHIDDILVDMSTEKITEFGMTTARILTNNFDKRLFIRLTFHECDMRLARLLKNSVQTVKTVMTEATKN